MGLNFSSKLITTIGSILIIVIKLGIRPFFQFQQPTQFLLNIAPNLISAFLIPFVIHIIFMQKNFLNERIFKVEVFYNLKTVCCYGFVFLLINEYCQLIPFFGRTFDYNDILFSSIGLMASYYVFSKIQHREFLHNESLQQKLNVD